MIRITLPPYLSSNHLLPCKILHHRLRLSPLPLAGAGLPIMASSDTVNGACSGGGGYPSPLSPPYPALSKEVELSRAMSAAARSGAYALLEIDIVFEDEWMVVVNKHSGVYCETLLSSISSRPSTANIQSELHLANRLDRDTSGLMVITKSHKIAAKLVKAFTDHKVKKTYLALCVGPSPRWEKIRISSGHGRSRFGAWRVYSASDVGRSLPGGSTVKHMATSFQVMSVNGRGEFKDPAEFEGDEEVDSIVVQEKIEECSGNGSEEHDEVLIRAHPESGRTHQIRLHCQYLGIPIRGDVKYGGVHEWKGITFDAHALHADTLSFVHPGTGLLLHFRATLPLWASEICAPTTNTN